MFSSTRLEIESASTAMVMKMRLRWSSRSVNVELCLTGRLSLLLRRSPKQPQLRWVKLAHTPRSCLLGISLVKLSNWIFHSENFPLRVYHSVQVSVCNRRQIASFIWRTLHSWLSHSLRLRLPHWNVSNTDWSNSTSSSYSKTLRRHPYTSTRFKAHRWMTWRIGLSESHRIDSTSAQC